MSITVASLISTWTDGKRMHVVGLLAFSGNYVTGGVAPDFGAGGVQTSQPPVWLEVQSSLGFLFPPIYGTDQATTKLKVMGAGDTAATVTLTSDTTNTFTDGETITLGSVVYTLKSTLSTGPAVANEIKIAASVTATLDNIKSAVNATAGAGTTYGTGTVANPDLSAGTKTGTTILFTAVVSGSVGNALPSTETCAHLSFGSTTFAGGVDATGTATELAAAAFPTDLAASSPRFYAIFPQLI